MIVNNSLKLFSENRPIKMQLSYKFWNDSSLPHAVAM